MAGDSSDILNLQRMPVQYQTDSCFARPHFVQNNVHTLPHRTRVNFSHRRYCAPSQPARTCVTGCSDPRIRERGSRFYVMRDDLEAQGHAGVTASDGRVRFSNPSDSVVCKVKSWLSQIRIESRVRPSPAQPRCSSLILRPVGSAARGGVPLSPGCYS